MFKKFENSNKRYEERITITRSMSFGFPSKFFNENNLSNFSYVVLYFDSDTREIGFKFTNDETEKSKFKLFGSGKSGGDYGGNIVARSFFKEYSIDTNLYRGKYNVEKRIEPEIGEIFVIKLTDKQTADVTGSSVENL